MATAHVLISTQTISSAVNSITFSSISQTYRDLIIVSNASANTTGQTLLRFNGDAGSNYMFTTLEGNGTAASSGNSASTFAFFVWVGNGDLGGTQSNAVLQIMDYSATDKIKTVLGRTNQTGDRVAAATAKWNNTAAITSVLVAAGGSGQTFNVGSIISLYGVLA